jgi:hypothetical protein
MIKVRINPRNRLFYQKRPQDFYAESPESTAPAKAHDFLAEAIS